MVIRATLPSVCPEYLTEEQQLEVLKAKQEMLKKSIKSVEKRIKNFRRKSKVALFLFLSF